MARPAGELQLRRGADGNGTDEQKSRQAGVPRNDLSPFGKSHKRGCYLLEHPRLFGSSLHPTSLLSLGSVVATSARRRPFALTRSLRRRTRQERQNHTQPVRSLTSAMPSPPFGFLLHTSQPGSQKESKFAFMRSRRVFVLFFLRNVPQGYYRAAATWGYPASGSPKTNSASH